MRLGGPLFEPYTDPDTWVNGLKRLNYRATYCPDITTEYTPNDYASAARMADIIIAEVGIWNNPLSPDETVRQEALRACQAELALADEIEAICCVNISGSRGSN